MNSRMPSEEFLNRMFGLLQETHPERLFVLDKIKEPGLVIYDLGAGRHKTLPGAMGVDIEPVTDIQASIDDMPMIKSDTVDKIISRHSFEHLIDPVKALAEWARILKPGGEIIFVLPDYEALDTMNPILSGGFHCHAYTKKSLSALIEVAPSLHVVQEMRDVVPGWSFGGIVQKHGLSLDSRDVTFLVMGENIRNGDNFSFVKMGDGEMLAMLGAQGANCDGQSYGEKLAKSLKEAYKSFSDKPWIRITRWKLPGMEKEIENFEKELGILCTEDHDLLMNRVGEISSDHYEFWKTIKESKRRKIFVGPERLSGIVNFLNVDQMKIVPQSNAFDKDMDFKPEKDDIWLFSAGLASKAWIAEVLKMCPNVTCIDSGSAFDPIFVGGTRTNQLPQAYLKEFYKDLLK